MSESNSPTPSEKSKSNAEKPSFHYDLDLFNNCKTFLDTKNHHGLALMARQRGIPPFLRFKIWPILLKYHPYVLNPFIQPDNDADDKKDDEPKVQEKDEDLNAEIKVKIRKDITKYIQRLKFRTESSTPLETETAILEKLESAVLRFALKWGRIIKYDAHLTWIALNLAEWFPPIPGTPWVLVGRDNNSSATGYLVNLMDDYSNYIDNIPGLKEYLDKLIADPQFVNMPFHDVYERLVLVLLHSPEQKGEKSEKTKKSTEKTLHSNNDSSSTVNKLSSISHKQLNKTILPITGGTIEERVSFFIYSLRKVLPDLLDYFHEEHILNKFGIHDDEWLIWWLNYCGAKMWSKYDRGRIWDLLLGWRISNAKKENSYYVEKVGLSRKTIAKLGPDNFWSLKNDEELEFAKSVPRRRNSFRELVDELNDKNEKPASVNPSRRPSDTQIETSIPFAKLDAHIELIFIALAFLKSQQNILVELDQHEIRQYLSRLPTKSYKYKQQKKKTSEGNSTSNSGSNSTSNSAINSREASPSTQALSSLSLVDDLVLSPSASKEPLEDIIISNDSIDNHKVDFMDNIINEAGELWRKWLWLEMIDDN